MYAHISRILTVKQSITPRSAAAGGGGLEAGGVLGHDAIDHADDAIGGRDDVEVVRDHHDGDPLVAIDVAEEADDLAARVGIEVAGSSARRTAVHEERASDGRPLLSPPEIARPVLDPVREADAIEQLLGPGTPLRSRLPPARGRGRRRRA